MPNLKGPPEDRIPERPFNVTMVGDFLVLEGLLDELEVHTFEVSMPRSWGEGSSIEHCYIKVRTSVGDVAVSRKTFAAAFLAAIAAIEALQSLDGQFEERQAFRTSLRTRLEDRTEEVVALRARVDELQEPLRKKILDATLAAADRMKGKES